MNRSQLTLGAIATIAVVLIGSPLFAQEVPDALERNMPYSDAREMLMEAEWQPIEVTGRENPSETVTRLVDLGYGEVVDCAGTGMGFCRFEFVNEAGKKLAIVTVNNQAEGEGSLLYRWWVEESSQEEPGRS
jgi:hypothetical protein